MNFLSRSIMVTAFVLGGSVSISAQEIDSLESASQIPELESAQEKLEVLKSLCPYGNTYIRRIEVRFQGRPETFTGFISSKFIETLLPAAGHSS